MFINSDDFLKLFPDDREELDVLFLKEVKSMIKALEELSVDVGDRVYSVDVEQDIKGIVSHDIDNIVITSDDILLKADAYDDVICTLSNLNNGSLYCGYKKVFRTEEEANKFLESLTR